MLDLDDIIENAKQSEPDVPLPSLEEQKRIVAELKALEAKGELTPEILARYFEHKAQQ